MNNRKNLLFLPGGLIVALAVGFLFFPFNNGSAADDEKTSKSELNTPQSAKQGPPNFDVLADRPARSSSLQNRVRNGRVKQIEPRFDVPTFFWASDPGVPQTVGGDSLQRKNNQTDIARNHLGRFAAQYRLSKTDVAAAQVAAVHDTGNGAIIVKFKQTVGGIEVFRDEVNVIMNRQLQLVALSGFLTGDNTGDALQNFTMQPVEALSKALHDLTGASVEPSLLQPVQRATNLQDGENPYRYFTADGKALTGFIFSDEPSRVKKVLFHLPDAYVPAYYVETSVLVPSDEYLSATGGPAVKEFGYSYVISAIDGEILFRNNLIAEQKTAKLIAEQKTAKRAKVASLGGTGFTYRVWADPLTKIPFDTPAGNNHHPKLNALPDGAQYGFVPQHDVSLSNFPFSQNDPWLPAGATETNGNNVDAFLNLFSPDGLGSPTTTTPTDLPTGDFRAQATGFEQFLSTHVAGTNTSTAAARQGSIQQLFYNINFLHDWYYDAGFNEASGNAQTDNYGRGGLAADNIRAQVQDFAGFSNANMLTPADGSRPRMRMYIFPAFSSMIDIQAPASIAGKTRIGISMSGPQVFDVTAGVVRATFAAGTCNVTNVAALDGKIALYDFDNTDGTGCSFSTRLARITTTTNAVAVMMAYTSGNANSIANVTGYVAANNKPFVTISWNTAAPIKTQLAVPNTVTVRLNRTPDRDGTIDNQIVAHEWGHYISNRLIGNANGLNANNAGGLGEGWGDFTSMLLTVRPEDTVVPTNSTWNGAYAMATYATSGVDINGIGNNGYYFGIRRLPYSTDMVNINPLTYRHTANGQPIPAGPPIAFGADGSTNAAVHNIGEVWATMLWECYASLLRDTQFASPRLTFQQAQDRMKNYLVAAYKMTPINPTLLEARDAVLAAAFANDPVDGARFAQAFAKRGAGTNAVAPDRFSTTNVGVVEDFTVAVDLNVTATLDDSITSYDDDGYLDSREKGLLKITVKNTSLAILNNPVATVSSTDARIGFPNGASVSVPPLIPFAAPVTVSVVVEAGNMFNTLRVSDFNISIDEASSSLVAPITTPFPTYTNADELLINTATDNVEAKQTPWTIVSNPALDQSASSKWRRNPIGSLNHVWFGPDPEVGSDQYLVSPAMTVDGGGSFNLQFDHSWGFEFDGGGNYDGGVIEMSVNGGAFTDIGTTAYNGTLITYAGNVNPLQGRPAFVQNSAGTIHTSLSRAIAPGSTVMFRFRIGADSAAGAAGWQIDNIAVNGVVETPFTRLVGELAPTAAAVSVEGRVSAEGHGVARAIVYFTDQNGVTRSATTNTFGYYRFDNIQTGSSYVFNAKAKGFIFAPRVVSVTDSIADLDFTAE